MDWIPALLAGYFVGSIPFGLILAKAAGQGDIRKIGSGNIGATNVLRTGNKWLAALVLLLDLGKGWLGVMIAWHVWPAMIGFAAVGAVLGHCFPLWLKFKGGKGVATAIGTCLGLYWPIALVFAVVWLAMLAISRISSLGGMSAAIAAPIASWLLGEPEFVPFLAAITAIVLWQHRANIGRLLKGQEPKVGSKS